MNYFVANRKKRNRTVRLINRPLSRYSKYLGDVLINSLDEDEDEDVSKMIISLRRGRDTYFKLKSDIFRRW
jgi:hypothetical protein